MSNDRKYLLLATCWMLLMWLFAYRGMLIALLPSIASTLSLTNTMAGSLVGVLWTSDALGAFPAGIATAYISRKRLLTLSLALSTFFMLVFISLEFFPAMLVSLFFAGLGFGSYYPIGVSILSEKFRGRRFGTFIGLHETGVPFGKTIGPLIASALLLIQIDWRMSLILGLIAVPVILFFLSVAIRGDQPLSNSKGAGFKTRSWSTYIRLLVFAVCVVGLDMGLTSMIPIFMVDALHVGNSEVALVFGATRVFGTVGIVISGYLSDKFNKGSILVVVVSIATFAALAITILPYNAFFILALTTLAAASSSYWPVIMTIMSEISSKEDLPKIIGFQGMTCGLLGGGLTPVIIGYLADLFNFRTAFVYPIALGILGVIVAVSLRIESKKPKKSAS